MPDKKVTINKTDKSLKEYASTDNRLIVKFCKGYSYMRDHVGKKGTDSYKKLDKPVVQYAILPTDEDGKQYYYLGDDGLQYRKSEYKKDGKIFSVSERIEVITVVVITKKLADDKEVTKIHPASLPCFKKFFVKKGDTEDCLADVDDVKPWLDFALLR